MIAVTAIGAALSGFADAGVEAELSGGHVISVDPAGFAWRDGIRPGQLVIRLVGSDEPDGWLIESQRSDGSRVISRASQYDEALQHGLPVAALALIVAILGLASSRAAPRGSAAASIVAILLASVSLATQGDPGLSALALVACFVVPVGWLVGRSRSGTVIFVGGGLTAIFALAWIWARGTGDPTSVGLEQTRSAAAFLGSATALTGLVALPIVRREFRPLSPIRTVDLVSLTVVAAASVGLVAFVHVSPVVVGVMLLGLVVIYPRWRVAATVGADRLLLSDLRERAAIEATEEERARVAHDLHDSPLQQLAGVIRRLDLVPGTRSESEVLRSVAADLRAVATDLRPPALDDLGLAAGLTFLAVRATSDELPVLTRLDTSGDSRPPIDVEIAVYRIVEEAISNAIVHAEASEVLVSGHISPDAIALEVRDDGLGLSRDAVDRAARQGRLGLASMRRRAALVGADLRLSTADGTVVEIKWAR